MSYNTFDSIGNDTSNFLPIVYTYSSQQSETFEIQQATSATSAIGGSPSRVGTDSEVYTIVIARKYR
jgi:hypothetical protein